MIFIIGGACQGKKKFAAEKFAGYEIVEDYHLRVLDELKRGLNPLDEAETFYDDAVRQNISDRTVVISDELGLGIVPLDRDMRRYRELNGRVNCFFAGKASAVYRVICGIAQKIK